MCLTESVKKILKDSGRTQTWVIEKMNELNSNIEMDRCKMSSIKNGKRKMSADELLVFCMVMKVNPNVFVKFKRQDSA